MSDTPKTDVVAVDKTELDSTFKAVVRQYVPIAFAREQERRIAELEKDRELAAINEESLALARQEIERLKTKLTKYEQNKSFGEAAQEALQRQVDEGIHKQLVDDSNPF